MPTRVRGQGNQLSTPKPYKRNSKRRAQEPTITGLDFCARRPNCCELSSSRSAEIFPRPSLFWRHYGITTRTPAARRLRTVAQVRGPHGTIARLHVGPTVRGFQCWRASFSTGHLRGGCIPPFSPGPQTNVDLVQPAGRDLFFVGTAGRRTSRIEIRFANGDILPVRPVAGHFVVAAPRSHLSTRQQRAFVIAFDRDGRRALRQRLFFRLP